MYFIEKDEKLTPKAIGKIINAFKTSELPKLNRYWNYYEGNQEILRREIKGKDKPNNRIVSNYMDEIVNTYAGYLTGIDITYTSDEDIEIIQNVLNYNDVSYEDSAYLKDALIYGVAYEVNWIDPEGKQRFKKLDPRECIPVYENTVEQELSAVIRFYAVESANASQPTYYVDVYDTREITSYKSNQNFSSFELLDYIPNFYGMVPITVLELNEERESIFHKVMSLQDSYNLLLSDEVNNFSAFVDAYMVLKGIYDVEEEQLSKMRENRVLVLPDNGTAEYLNKNISDTQIENMLENIRNTIREISACPDFTDESFGTQSGISIRYKLLNFENRAGQIEKQMTKALQRRIELICSILSITSGEELWRDVKIQFTRNLPVDETETVNMVNALRGLVSTKTLISQLSFITDIDAEMDQLAQEKEENLAMYDFGDKDEEDLADADRRDRKETS